MTSSRVIERDGVRYVEVVEPGDGGTKLYRLRGNELRGQVDVTGEQTGRRVPRPTPGLNASEPGDATMRDASAETPANPHRC